MDFKINTALVKLFFASLTELLYLQSSKEDFLFYMERCLLAERNPEVSGLNGHYWLIK